jgi:hypothetical protein
MEVFLAAPVSRALDQFAEEGDIPSISRLIAHAGCKLSHLLRFMAHCQASRGMYGTDSVVEHCWHNTSSFAAAWQSLLQHEQGIATSVMTPTRRSRSISSHMKGTVRFES